MLKYPCIGVLAAALVEPGRYELRDYPLPKPRSGCVLVKMNMSGICGTDKHTYQGYTTQYFSAGKGEKIPFRSYENTGKVAGLGGDGQYNDFEGIPLGISACRRRSLPSENVHVGAVEK